MGASACPCCHQGLLPPSLEEEVSMGSGVRVAPAALGDGTAVSSRAAAAAAEEEATMASSSSALFGGGRAQQSSFASGGLVGGTPPASHHNLSASAMASATRLVGSGSPLQTIPPGRSSPLASGTGEEHRDLRPAADSDPFASVVTMLFGSTSPAGPRSPTATTDFASEAGRSMGTIYSSSAALGSRSPAETACFGSARGVASLPTSSFFAGAPDARVGLWSSANAHANYADTRDHPLNSRNNSRGSNPLFSKVGVGALGVDLESFGAPPMIARKGQAPRPFCFCFT